MGRLQGRLSQTYGEFLRSSSRLWTGDPHVAAELRASVMRHLAHDSTARTPVARTVGELRARAETRGLAREREAAETLAAEQKRRTEEAEKASHARRAAIAQRGESVWHDIEAEIERRHATAYDTALELLLDLQTIAKARGAVKTFQQRLNAIKERHARKTKFIERLRALE